MAEISVIVPVYKVENYLERCIKSLLNQSYTDFELLLVNDGSPDYSGMICDRYAEKDSRVRVIHQKNMGVSYARNIGLENAKGAFVAFVDSDDEVEENYLSCMMSVGTQIDIVMCGMKHINTSGELWHITSFKNEKVANMSRDKILQIMGSKAGEFIQSKRFKKSIIDNREIQFDVAMNFGEDTYFMAQYLCACSTAQYIDASPYVYYKYEHHTLSEFSIEYVERLELVNEKIKGVLTTHFGEINEISAWKQCCFGIYYFCIFYILQSDNYNFVKKYLMLSKICKNKKFQSFLNELDVYMPEDSKLLRMIISTKKAIIYLIFWKMLDVKKRHVK